MNLEKGLLFENYYVSSLLISENERLEKEIS